MSHNLTPEWLTMVPLNDLHEAKKRLLVFIEKSQGIADELTRAGKDAHYNVEDVTNYKERLKAVEEAIDIRKKPS